MKYHFKQKQKFKKRKHSVALVIYIFQKATATTKYEPHRKKTCSRWFANTKWADQPAPTGSLISAFVIRLL